MSETGKMLGLGESLQKMVSRKFQAAHRNKHLLFSDTTLSVLRTKAEAPVSAFHGIGVSPTQQLMCFKFQLRYCPALAEKPKGDGKSPSKDAKRSKFDPFAEPPEELLVASVPSGQASHALVLNKFPVIQNHFIMATTANKPQTDLLEDADICMTLACLRAWKDDQADTSERRLFAFFNSGEHSGASQVHRHVQFLPVEDMSGSEPNDWGLLLDRMTTRAHPELPLFQDPSLPFLHFSTPIEEEPLSTTLYSRYVLLMNAALSAARFPHQPLVQDMPIEKNGQTVFSYNLAMTTDRMAICPRRSEAAAIPTAGPDSSVALNGTILAGTLMVKRETEWDILRQSPCLLDDMLSVIGYPPVSWATV